jgi:hypothetical protein
MFLTIKSLVVLSALFLLTLFGASNGRNYPSHSTMRTLPEMTISCSLRGIMHNIVKFKINLDTIVFE